MIDIINILAVVKKSSGPGLNIIIIIGIVIIIAFGANILFNNKK